MNFAIPPCVLHSYTSLPNIALLCSNPLQTWIEGCNQVTPCSCLPRTPVPTDEGRLGSSGSLRRQTPTIQASETGSAGCFPSVRNLIRKDKLEKSMEQPDIPFCTDTLLQKQRWKAASPSCFHPQGHLTKGLVVNILFGKLGCLKTCIKNEMVWITV